MENTKLSKYQRAQERVLQLKNFYNHVVVYVVVNILLLFFRNNFRFTLISKETIGNPDFLSWIDWNVFGTAIVWGLFLIFHAVKVFGGLRVFGEEWEERQVQKFMKEDNQEML